jgi:hypothetical protein
MRLGVQSGYPNRSRTKARKDAKDFGHAFDAML